LAETRNVNINVGNSHACGIFQVNVLKHVNLGLKYSLVYVTHVCLLFGPLFEM